MQKIEPPKYSIINATAGKYCSVAFILNGHTSGLSTTSFSIIKHTTGKYYQ